MSASARNNAANSAAWALEFKPFDIGPGHVLWPLAAVDEDQHAAIRVAEVAAATELQLLAV